MLKVLHLNSNISPRSGVMKVLLNYHSSVAELDAGPIQIDYCYYAQSPQTYENQIANLGGKSFRIPSPKNIRQFMKTLGDSISSYDIVHLHDPNLTRFVYPVVKRNEACHLIVHSHATAYSDKPISSIRNRVLCRNLADMADALFACSDAAGRFLFGSNSFYLMRNAISVSEYSFSEEVRRRLRMRLGINDECLAIGHVGNYVRQKNHSFLVKVFAQIRHIKQNCKLILVGDGVLMADVRRQIRDLGLDDSVIILGVRDDVADLYQAMDVFVLPSLYEGLPMVGVEAQASGLPVLFSTRITREVDIASSLFLGLEQGADEWAQAAIDMGERCRIGSEETKDLLRAKGYDVMEEARKLIEKYRNIANN